MAGLRVELHTRAARASLERLREDLAPTMRRELIRLSPRLERIYATAAPKRSGKLAREIRSEFRGADAIEVVSPVRSAEGFPYTGVTRFGHQSAWIYPRKARALRFTIGGTVRFAARVRGYRPAQDWADKGLPVARNELAAAASRIARAL